MLPLRGSITGFSTLRTETSRSGSEKMSVSTFIRKCWRNILPWPTRPHTTRKRSLTTSWTTIGTNSQELHVEKNDHLELRFLDLLRQRLKENGPAYVRKIFFDWKLSERKAGKPFGPGQTSVRPGRADRFLAPKSEGERDLVSPGMIAAGCRRPDGLWEGKVKLA